MRFMRLASILLLASVALVGTMLLRGHADAQPNELRTLGFDFCDDRLCFMGIMPGVTSPDEADRLLVERGATWITTSWSAYVMGDKRIWFSAVGPVTTVTVDTDSDRPLTVTLGNVLNYLGSPCRVVIGVANNGWNRLMLVYPFGYVNALSEHQLKMNAATAISSILIFAPYAGSHDCERGLPWLGLKSIERYEDLRIQQVK